jgi:hypothetical protein
VKALEEINNESRIINSLCEEWGVEKSKILQTANRFFTDYKKFGNRIKKLDQSLLDYQIKLLLSDPNAKVFHHQSEQENPSLYCSFMNNYAEDLNKAKKGIIFYNEDFIYGMIGAPELLSEEDFTKFLNTNKKEGVNFKYTTQKSISLGKAKKINNIYQFMVIHKFDPAVLAGYLANLKFNKI